MNTTAGIVTMVFKLQVYPHNSPDVLIFFLYVWRALHRAVKVKMFFETYPRDRVDALKSRQRAYCAGAKASNRLSYHALV